MKITKHGTSYTIGDEYNSVNFLPDCQNEGDSHQPETYVRCLGQLEEDFGEQDSGLSEETLLAGLAKITGLSPDRIALPYGQDGGHDWDETGEKSYIGWAYEIDPNE